MKRIYLTIVKRMLFLALCVFSVFASTNNLYAQSSIGIEFWIAFPQNYNQGGNRQLYITAEQDAVVSINIVNPAFSTTINVAGGTLETVELPTSVDITSNGVAENKGIHIVSDNPVSVYGMNLNNASTDAFMAIPVDAIGTEYYVMSYANLIVVQTTIVATEDNTTVTVTATATGGGFTSGVPGNIVINKGQVFQLSSSGYGADYSGSKVVSDKPVSVFGGNSCANVPIGTTYCDHLVEQMISTDKWGKSFVTVPLATRSAGDIFRIMAQENNTEVIINGSVVATLNAGKFYETSLGSSTYNRITANKPILVGQFAKGTSADGVTSDPFFSLVPPDEQFLNNYIVSAGTSSIPINFLNITSPTANIGTVKVDNVVPSVSWTQIPGTTFSGAQIPVTNGIHKVNSSLPVGLLVYGFGDYDSYGYLGGQAFGAVATVSSLAISPKTGSGALNTNQCWEAKVLDQFGAPVTGVRVDFNITGVNSGSSGFAFTNTSGVATFCYKGENQGVDNIKAVLGSFSDNASFTWGTPDDEAPIIGACGKTYIVQLQKVTYLKKTVWRGKLPQELIKNTITDNIDHVSDGSLKVKFSQTEFMPNDWGTNTETVTATDASGNTVTCNIKVIVRYPLKSGEVDIYAEMDDSEIQQMNVAVYPNPTRGKLTIDFWNLNNPEVRAVVYNLSGQVVFQDQFSTEGQINIDLTGKISGIYLLKVFADEKEFTHKIILEDR